MHTSLFPCIKTSVTIITPCSLKPRSDTAAQAKGNAKIKAAREELVQFSSITHTSLPYDLPLFPHNKTSIDSIANCSVVVANYTLFFVFKLPLSEQLKITRQVKFLLQLSSIF